MISGGPKLSRRRLSPSHAVEARDEQGDTREVRVAGERPLTLFIDDRELITLMTLGTRPEELALGYLRNQRLFDDINDIASVETDWDRERVDITTRDGRGVADWEEKLAHKTVTTGCGQGTIFSCSIDKLYERRLSPQKIKQSVLYKLLHNIAKLPTLYKTAGAVHGCAVCRGAEPLMFIEDVGRHNAADAIAGMLWLEDMPGDDLIFYTTGRLTSEIVMKSAHLGAPTLLSRSGVTHMGLELAADLNITMIARAKGRHFLVYNNADFIEYDDKPARTPRTAVRQSGSRSLS